jgi:hypothetical protein
MTDPEPNVTSGRLEGVGMEHTHIVWIEGRIHTTDNAEDCDDPGCPWNSR